MFTSPSQIIFSIFGLNIYYYGVILAIAICVGVLVADWAGKHFFNLKKDTIIDASPYLIIFGIIGARLYYCLLNLEFYTRFPTEIFAIRHGGISIHGAILGGLVGLIIFAKRHNFSIPKLCDTSCIGLAIAQAIGRWGNFFNSEAFGTPTDLPWKLYIAPQYRPIPYQENEYFHPAFLYESILNIGIFFVLLLIITKFKLKSGNLALIYLILYSFVRIIVESIRLDSVMYILGMPIAILISIFIIIISVLLIILNNRKSGETNEKV